MENQEKTVTKINNIAIVYLNDKDKMVPIKPICELLGVAFEPQYKKIKNDQILSSTVTLRVTVGGDGKDREMVCLPYMFIFGWLFSINPDNVAPEAKEKVLLYKEECYRALFLHFAEHSTFVEDKQVRVKRLLDEQKTRKLEFSTAKKRLDETGHRLDEVMALDLETWREQNTQYPVDWDVNRTANKYDFETE